MANKTCRHTELPNLYRIGVFAQMNKVTVKTLHHYDEIGILNPAHVDEQNGYRYYTSDQLPTLHRILALRRIGFSLEEIRQVIVEGREEQSLQKKKSELLDKIADLTKQISCIESYLSYEDTVKRHHVIIKSLPEVRVACMKVHLSNYGELFEKMPEMGVEMEKSGCVCAEPDYCFTLYEENEYREENINARICQAITKIEQKTDRLECITFPYVEEAACTLHRGSYESFPESYRALVTYIERNGYEIIGTPRESYIDGMWNKDYVADWLSELQIPVKKRK